MALIKQSRDNNLSNQTNNSLESVKRKSTSLWPIVGLMIFTVLIWTVLPSWTPALKIILTGVLIAILPFVTLKKTPLWINLVGVTSAVFVLLGLVILDTAADVIKNADWTNSVEGLPIYKIIRIPIVIQLLIGFIGYLGASIMLLRFIFQKKSDIQIMGKLEFGLLIAVIGICIIFVTLIILSILANLLAT